MAKTNSDSGAARNNGNLQVLITELQGLGERYVPGDASFSVPALEAVLANTTAAATNLANVLAKYRPAIDAKEEVFARGNKLLSRIIGALKTGRASAGTLETAKSFVNKYRGSVKKAKQEDSVEPSGAAGEATANGNGEPKPERSNRQTSYDFLIQHFEGLYQTVANEPKFKPSPADLTLAALGDLLSQMREAVKSSGQAKSSLSNARQSHWTLHDHPETGLVSLAQLAKTQLLTDFGSRSVEYKRVSGLKFKLLRQENGN
ncbi:MAG: hypothetical protein AAB316_20415 [Bacteroidota bacterium]